MCFYGRGRSISLLKFLIAMLSQTLTYSRFLSRTLYIVTLPLSLCLSLSPHTHIHTHVHTHLSHVNTLSFLQIFTHLYTHIQCTICKENLLTMKTHNLSLSLSLSHILTHMHTSTYIYIYTHKNIRAIFSHTENICLHFLNIYMCVYVYFIILGFTKCVFMAWDGQFLFSFG